MKNFILLCLFFISTLGHTFNSDNTIGNKETTINSIATERFLTSFIEGNQVYLNIPKEILDKPMLFICYDKSKHSYMQVVWSLSNDKILLKNQSIESTAGVIIPIAEGYFKKDNVLGIFSSEEIYRKPDSYCINITDLVLKQDIEWPQRFGVYFGNPVPRLSMLLETRSLENEVIIKVQRGMVRSNFKVGVPLFYGFYPLGKTMKERRYDYRMGFYNEKISDINYGINNEGNFNSIANISRWRLEKKHKDQKVSLPVKPITFIMSPDIPKKWQPYVKAGIEEWLPAFEAAGFKDAIVVKEVDSLSEWQLNSIENNIVFWGPSKHFRTKENEEYGGTASIIIDYRTGEILKSDIYLSATRQNLEDRYFIRAAPLDRRAQRFPFPDDLTGRLYQCLTAHEAGHAFGLMDGNYGEGAYPFEKMTDLNWLETMGYTPSIMNYTRPNNIVQPEDNISPHLLVQKVGPTDQHNIQWAYTEFPEATTPEQEEILLEQIIRRQDSVPWYRFNASKYEVIGPGRTDEVVETNDPVKSTAEALKNIKRVVELLPEVCKDQKDNARLIRLYNKTLDLWYHHMRHVVSVIGGYNMQYKSINQPGNIYTPIPMLSQIEALDFLFQNAFNPPDWLVNPEFISKMKYSVYPDKILQFQLQITFELLRGSRFNRLEYMNNIDGYDGVFSIFFEKLQDGIFKELKDGQGNVKPRNQAIQVSYIDYLGSIILQNKKNALSQEIMDFTENSKGLIMQHLTALKKDIEIEIKKNKESSSLGHWELCLNKLNEI